MSDNNFMEHQPQRNPEGLDSRIEFYKQYGKKRRDWYPWVSDHITISAEDSVLEIGSGSGKLWKEGDWQFKTDKKIILSDLSKEMVSEARQALSDRFPEFQYMRIDAHNIPFPSGSFDVVIANHVLHLVDEIDTVLSEIERVLAKGGVLYATTKSSRNFEGVDQMLQRAGANNNISINNVDQFELETAAERLQNHFEIVKKDEYIEYVQVTDAAPLISFVESKLDMNKLTRFNLEKQIRENFKQNKHESSPFQPPIKFEKRMGILEGGN